MDPVKAELAAALRQRFAIISDEASRRDASTHIARLQGISKKIDALEQQLPAPVDPQLKHYLQRCSYGKALEFLESNL